MVWLWEEPDEDLMPIWGNFDDKNSSFKSSDVLTEKPLGTEAGEAIIRVKYHKLCKVCELKSLPNTSSTPLIDGDIQAIIRQHANEDEVQFYPAIVRTHDGETDRYSFAIPLMRASCIDLERSVITSWIVEGKEECGLLGLKSVCHKKGCLGHLHMAREKLFESHVLVSDSLKIASEAMGDKGIKFVLPEDLGEQGF